VGGGGYGGVFAVAVSYFEFDPDLKSTWSNIL
jgi:hypothetical protein